MRGTRCGNQRDTTLTLLLPVAPNKSVVQQIDHVLAIAQWYSPTCNVPAMPQPRLATASPDRRLIRSAGSITHSLKTQMPWTLPSPAESRSTGPLLHDGVTAAAIPSCNS